MSWEEALSKSVLAPDSARKTIAMRRTVCRCMVGFHRQRAGRARKSLQALLDDYRELGTAILCAKIAVQRYGSVATSKKRPARGVERMLREKWMGRKSCATFGRATKNARTSMWSRNRVVMAVLRPSMV